MKETAATISEWAKTTFGPASTHKRVLTRVLEEVVELLVILSSPDFDPAKLREECADIAIVMAELGNRFSVNIFEEFLALSSTAVDRDNLDESELRIAHHAMRELLILLMLFDQGVPMIRDIERHCLRALGQLCKIVYRSCPDEMDHGERLDQYANAIDGKMEINRNRDWRLDGTGHGYHTSGEDFSEIATKILALGKHLEKEEAQEAELALNELLIWAGKQVQA